MRVMRVRCAVLMLCTRPAVCPLSLSVGQDKCPWRGGWAGLTCRLIPPACRVPSYQVLLKTRPLSPLGGFSVLITSPVPSAEKQSALPAELGGEGCGGAWIWLWRGELGSYGSYLIHTHEQECLSLSGSRCTRYSRQGDSEPAPTCGLRPQVLLVPKQRDGRPVAECPLAAGLSAFDWLRVQSRLLSEA